MSVQFGRWNFEGQSADPGYIENVSAALAPYGPDSNEAYSNGGVQILYRAFHTIKESYREKQPCISPSGAVITWDGRLDNRADLISDLRDVVSINSTDLDIVVAAYDKWGANCFAMLVGDWALSIWNTAHRSLLLARDPIGTKHLYYSVDSYQISWSLRRVHRWLVIVFPRPPSGAICWNSFRRSSFFSPYTARKAHGQPVLGFRSEETDLLSQRWRIRRALSGGLRRSCPPPTPLGQSRPRRVERRHGLLLHCVHGRHSRGPRCRRNTAPRHCLVLQRL